MLYIKCIFFTFCFLLCVHTSYAQSDTLKKKAKSISVSHSHEKSKLKKFFKETPWVFTLSGHVVDDDGKPFDKLFNARNSWNFLYFPAKIGIEGEYREGWSFGTDCGYTQFQPGKAINSEIQTTTSTFFSADGFVKYKLKGIFGNMAWFDPYAIAGYGYTLRTAAYNKNAMTANVGFGFNIWIWQNLGLNAQSMAKFAVIKNTSNYLNHSVGITYRVTSAGKYKPGRVGRRYKFIKSK